mmetsp:Transcript_5877/g.8898  ORF Transcript_5877/g.8898 Transcript_5877/m.8898 type:complete len:94 (+) Transcript_5877:411-692(+)
MHRRAYKFASGDGQRVGNCSADFTFPNRFGGQLLKRMQHICDYKFFMGKEDPLRAPFQLRASYPQNAQVQQQNLREKQLLKSHSQQLYTSLQT